MSLTVTSHLICMHPAGTPAALQRSDLGGQARQRRRRRCHRHCSCAGGHHGATAVRKALLTKIRRRTAMDWVPSLMLMGDVGHWSLLESHYSPLPSFTASGVGQRREVGRRSVNPTPASEESTARLLLPAPCCHCPQGRLNFFFSKKIIWPSFVCLGAATFLYLVKNLLHALSVSQMFFFQKKNAVGKITPA